MQTKKVKRLGINKLNEYPTISLEEQLTIKGGWGDNGAAAYQMKYNETLPPGIGYNEYTDECYLIPGNGGSSGNSSYGASYGETQLVGVCPACYAFDIANHPVAGHNHQQGGITTALGRLLFKILPHEMGIGQHTGN